jgi:opacity protein-like surface antigen
MRYAGWIRTARAASSALVVALGMSAAGEAADWFDSLVLDEATIRDASLIAPAPLPDPSATRASGEATVSHDSFGAVDLGDLTGEETGSPGLLTGYFRSVAEGFAANVRELPNEDLDCISECSSSRRGGGLLPPWRPYVGGIVGVSFATLDDDSPATPAVSNESVFTAGGTIGVAFDRPMGALRLEFEGRGRDQMTASESDPGIGSVTVRATDIWSAMVNVWRDYRPYENIGIYAGGGIGSGGYRSTISGTGLASLYTGNDPVTNFAWQAGGGVFYEVSPRMTLDLGYRFFAIDESTATAEFAGFPFDYRERYSASELLLTVRIYEPFRGWR